MSRILRTEKKKKSQPIYYKFTSLTLFLNCATIKCISRKTTSLVCTDGDQGYSVQFLSSFPKETKAL